MSRTSTPARSRPAGIVQGVRPRPGRRPRGRAALNLNLIVARQNAHEVDGMRAMAEAIGAPYHVFTNMSPTIYGGAESLPAQSVEHLRKRKPFTGCNAGVYPSPG